MMHRPGEVTQRSSLSPDVAGRSHSRSSPRKPSLSTRMAGVRGVHAASAGRLEPLVPSEGSPPSGSPLLSRSLSRPRKDAVATTTPSSSLTPSQGHISATLPRTLKLTPSPSPPPTVPLGHATSLERQQALDRKAAFLTAQIKSRQQQQHQRALLPVNNAPTTSVDGSHVRADCSTPRTDELSLTACSETHSLSQNVLTLDPTLHQPRLTPPGRDMRQDADARAPLPNSTPHSARPALDDEGHAEAPYHGNVLTDELLRDWTGWEDLPLVLSAEFRIDATKVLGLDQLSVKLPQLTSLKLNKSRIPQIRLLGSKYNQLKYLWLNNCRLEGLRGIGSCAPHLEELYACFNSLTDLSPLLDVSETLRVLDVEGNDIADAKMLSFVLPALRCVTSLTLQMNPIESDPAVQERLAQLEGTRAPTTTTGPSITRAGDVANQDDTTAGEKQLLALRRWVTHMMPQLEYFDDISVTAAQEDSPSRALNADDSASPDCTVRATSDSGCRQVASALSTGAGSRAKTRSVYVDPMDRALAEELRLVRECIRDSEFDMLDQTLETINSAVYSRPATSCEGAVPRSRPGSRLCSTSAGRLGQPSPSSVVATGRLGGASESSSSLTTGDVFAGSAISSLRRRHSPSVTPVLQTVTPTGTLSGRQTPSLHASPSAMSPLVADARHAWSMSPNGLRVVRPQVELGDHGVGSARTAAADNAPHDDMQDTLLDHAALFDGDDDEEGEWERFKSSLMMDEIYRQRPPSRRPATASEPRAVSRSTGPSVSPVREDAADDEQQRYQQLKLRMAAAAEASPAAGSTAHVTDSSPLQATRADESGKALDDAGGFSNGNSPTDQGLSAALSRPSTGTNTLRIGSASLSQPHFLSTFGSTVTGPSPSSSVLRQARSARRTAPLSGGSQRLCAPHSAGSQDRPISGEKSVGPDDSDDGFEGALKSELLHARVQLARSHVPFAGEDIVPE